MEVFRRFMNNNNFKLSLSKSAAFDSRFFPYSKPMVNWLIRFYWNLVLFLKLSWKFPVANIRYCRKVMYPKVIVWLHRFKAIHILKGSTSFYRYSVFIILFSFLVLKDYKVFSLPFFNSDEKTTPKTDENNSIDYYLKLSFDLIDIDPAKGIRISRKAEELAIQENDSKSIKRVYYLLGHHYNALNYHDSAITYLRLYLHDRSTLDSAADYSIYNLLGSSYNDIRKIDSANYFFNIARKIAESEGDDIKIAAVYNNLAINHDASGQLDTSISYYMKALRIFERIGEKQYAATIYGNIGLLSLTNGDNENALEYLQKALEISKEIGNNPEIIRATTNLGTAYSSLNRFDEAKQSFETGLNLSLQYEMDYEVSRAHFNLGNLFFKIADYPNALSHFQKSLAIAIELNIPQGILYNSINMAEIETRMGAYDSASARLEIADQIASDLSLEIHRDIILLAYTELESAKGNYKKALEYHKQYSSFVDSIRNERNAKQLHEMLTKYESEKKTLENEQLRDKNLIQKKEIYNQRLILVILHLVVLFLIGILVLVRRNHKKLAQVNQQLSELNTELSTERELLDLSNKTKDKFFSIIAHDLRNPFNSILGFSELLSTQIETKNYERVAYYSEIIKKSSQNAFELLINLLEWTRNQTGRIDFKPENINLFQVIENTTELFGDVAIQKSIFIEKDISKDTLVYADRDMLNTILRNLVSNAIKFSPSNGSITISAQETDNESFISIRDNGVGISKERIGKLFLIEENDSTIGTLNVSVSGLPLLGFSLFNLRLTA